MSRRDLSQPSFVDAMVSGCGKGAGFWTGSSRRSIGRRSRLCWLRFTLRPRRAGRSAAVMFKTCSCSSGSTLF